MWSSGGFAFAWLPAGTVAKGGVPDPKGGTGATSQVWSLATASSKLLWGTPAARLLPAWQPAPDRRETPGQNRGVIHSHFPLVHAQLSVFYLQRKKYDFLKT